ncbi:MAG: sigma-54 dependent transcriptional regulator [Nitrospira sp.]|jgi:DNA-binding NtrC family response regulator|nr:sigma-54 dependent transcriptional regulator [Nitrospira sp.]
MRAKILIVDDDRDILLGLENRMAWMGHEVLTAQDGKEGLRLIEQEHPDLVLLDLELPFLSGLDILKQIRDKSQTRARPGDSTGLSSDHTAPQVIILTAFGTVERAVQAMQLGACDFIPKPFTGEHLTVVINKALASVSLHRQVDVLRKEVAERYTSVTGRAATMAAPLKLAQQAAGSNTTVLLLGETGTGKEVMARAIHQWSPRRDKPFIAVNCAALPESLLENELFGHERGAFTGALKREPGKIEIAEGGTLFLDEIGDMPLPMQSHLLRVLQDQVFYRIGGSQAVHTDVRFIAATNKDLRQAIRQGAFREDLFYRLDIITLRLPPLRERIEDLPILADHFLSRAVQFGARQHCTLSPAALQRLHHYHWPGNIRELENVLTRALVLCEGSVIEPVHLTLSSEQTGPSSGNHQPLALEQGYHELMETYSRTIIEEALRRTGWNQTRSAELLGLQRTYLTKLLRLKQIPGRPPGGALGHSNRDDSRLYP